MSCERQVISTPRTVDIEITSNCNLHCSYCYYFGSDGESYSDLPTEEWLQFFRELGECGVMYVTLAGGEPFIRQDLRGLLAGLVDNRMRFSLLSNGGLIDDSIAAFIASTGRCDQVQVSLDGSCSEVHDVCRGAGSFDAAVAGIRILQKHGVSVGIRLTLHSGNVDDIEEASEFILNSLALPSFSVNSAAYLGSCRMNQTDIALSIDDRERAMRFLIAARSKYPGRIQAQAGPLADADAWRRMEAARLSEATHSSIGGRLTGCGCVFDRMAVRSDGVMIPCILLPHLALGRINSDSLRDVWQNADAMKAMRERQSVSLDTLAYCADCPYIPYCTGNCPAIAYTMTGSFLAPSPDACIRDFLANGGHLE